MESFRKLTPDMMADFSRCVRKAYTSMYASHSTYQRISQSHAESLCKRFLGEWISHTKQKNEQRTDQGPKR
jgi:hypothetical protein